MALLCHTLASLLLTEWRSGFSADIRKQYLICLRRRDAYAEPKNVGPSRRPKPPVDLKTSQDSSSPKVSISPWKSGEEEKAPKAGVMIE